MEVIIPGIILYYMVSASLAVSYRVYRVNHNQTGWATLHLVRYGKHCTYRNLPSNHPWMHEIHGSINGWAFTWRWALTRENTVLPNTTQRFVRVYAVKHVALNGSRPVVCAQTNLGRHQTPEPVET